MFSNVLTLLALPRFTPTAVTSRLSKARALARSRRALASLTKEQREDIGITARQAQEEAARPFWDAPEGLWDAPPHWCR